MTLIEELSALEVLDSRGNPTVEVACPAQRRRAGPRPGPERREHRQPRGGRAPRRRQGALRRQGRAPGRRQRRRPHRPRADRHRRRRPGRPRRPQLARSTAPRTRAGSAPTRSSGCRLAAARAAAEASGLPLYRYLGGVNAHLLPVPLLNVLNGGAHADRPASTSRSSCSSRSARRRFAEALRAGVRGLPRAQEVLEGAGLATGRGDEGGFAPSLGHNEEALEVLIEAIEKAGYQPGRGRRPRPRPRRQRVLSPTAGTSSRARAAPSSRASDRRPLGPLVRPVPDRLHRGRHGRGRLGRLAAADRAPRRPRPARRRRPLRHQHRAPQDGASSAASPTRCSSR